MLGGMQRVAAVSARSYEAEALRADYARLLEPLGGLGAFVEAGQRVLVKPNLLTAAPPEDAVTTHPELVRIVVTDLLALGAEVVVGDSPAFGSAPGVGRAAGIAAVCQELGVPLVNLSQAMRAENPGGKVFSHLTVSRVALKEVDRIINLPKLKGHQQAYFTCAAKNMFGCVPGKRKAWWHMKAGAYENFFGLMLVETLRLLAPCLTIVDGVVAMQGNGPRNGTPYPLGVLLAGPDALAVDRVAVDLIGYDPARVRTLSAWQELDGELPGLDRFELLGDALEGLRVHDFAEPRMRPLGLSLPRVVKSTVKHGWTLAREAAG